MTSIAADRIERHVRQMMANYVTYYRVKDNRDGLEFEFENHVVVVYYDDARRRFRCYCYPRDRWGDPDHSQKVEIF